MNVRQAILKAADSIDDGAPYRFVAIMVPNDCGTPACGLGWIGFHLGMHGKYAETDVHEALGLGKVTQGKNRKFYDRMEACGEMEDGSFPAAGPKEIASALRIYADQYHPETNHIPEWCLEIFQGEIA